MKGPDRRILLGWELGAGLGHVRRLVDVARRLRERGWTPYLALADLHALPEDVADVAEGVFQAPGLPIGGVGGRAIPIRSFADVLAVSGYAAELTLAAGVRAWESLLDLIRPRLVLADFSPILHLAAFGRVPVVAVGDGFCVPPALPGGFPVLRRNLRSAVDPEAMLENARRVQRRRGLPEPESLPEVVAGQRQFVCVLPELDAYRGRRQTPVAGPLHDLPPPLPVAQDPWKRSVFCYLPGDYAYTPTVLESLAGLGLQVDAYLHPPPEDVHALRLPAAVQLRSRPAPLPYALGRSALVVHHGGVGTAEQVLALGRPQLVLPKTLEQGLNARALSALGVATLLESDARTPHAIVSAVSELLDGPHAAQRASEVARGLRRAGSLPVLLDLCDLLAGP